MNWCKNSRTSTGKKEAVRLGHQKLIGSQPKRPRVPTFWRQELSSSRTRICTLDGRDFEYWTQTDPQPGKLTTIL
jgi:hypothetical protein